MNSLLLYLGIYSISLTTLVAFILLIKKILVRPLTAKVQYYLWFVLFVAAVAPFLPKALVPFRKAQSAGVLRASDTAAAGAATQANAAVQDLAVNGGGGFSEVLSFVLLAIWLLGSLLMLSRLLFHAYKAWSLRRGAQILSDPAAVHIYSQCSQQLGYGRHVLLKRSCLVHSPMTFGIFRPSILVPEPCNKGDLKYIFLHELSHCKHWDALFKLLMQLLLSVNWFNPAVWLAAARMESDREAFCDQAVMDLLGPDEQKDYGHAIINWAAWNRFSPALGIGGNKRQLRLRIIRIASYQRATLCRKRFSRAVLAVLVLLTLALVPPADALTAQSYHPASDLQLVQEDLSQHFGRFDGSFVLYNQQEDSYTVHNEAAAKTRVSPNSTYKIYSGLLALESGIISAKRSALAWDGTHQPYQVWNQDQDLSSAMRNSVNWYFQTLDQKAGLNKLQGFYDQIGYGNGDLSGGISDYWMESSLKISPLEQVMLLRNVYQNKWDFSQETITAVKDALRISGENGTFLSGKTGTGMRNGHMVNGWFIGYVEKGSQVYVFAANVQGDDSASGTAAMEIAKKILKEKKIL